MRVGDIFRRRRGFKRPNSSNGDPRIVWCVASIGETASAPDHGWQVVLVEEVVATKMMGDLAIYREWFLDPAGNELVSAGLPSMDKVRFEPADRLLLSLQRRNFEANYLPDLERCDLKNIVTMGSA
jgi:hypothetical protein